MNENQPPPAGDGSKELLLFQMGPVQEFIAQARSTLDLWSGSYLLSWLVAHAIVSAWNAEGGSVSFDDMVMPSIREKDNPLLFALMDQKSLMDDNQVRKALIPNLPNRFAMVVPRDTGKERAKAADKAIRDELANIGKSVWEWLVEHGAKTEWRDRFCEQIKAFPQITWAVRPWNKDEQFNMVWDAANDALAARRNTRDFNQWNPVARNAAVKDSLSGKEECIGDESFWENLRRDCPLFKTAGHCYGAMNLVKRLWCRVDDADTGKNYLASSLVFKDRQVIEALRVPDLPSIAKDNEDPSVPYVAILAFDGDHMGELVDEQKAKGKDGIRDISKALSGFALEKVPDIVEDHKGHLIYAGGDDVLAILPSSKAVACAKAIREAFHAAGDFGLDGSCGIAVGHCQGAPLQMLVRQAHHMEGDAKNRYGRGALAIAVYKRSGEILEWGSKWESKSLELMPKVTNLSKEGKLSGRFPYALAALLQPYELGKMTPDSFAEFKDVVLAEVDHVLSRQGERLSEKEMDDFRSQIRDHFDAVAKGVNQPETRVVGRELNEEEKKGEHKVLPDDFFGLFLVETFLNRKRDGK